MRNASRYAQFDMGELRGSSSRKERPKTPPSHLTVTAPYIVPLCEIKYKLAEDEEDGEGSRELFRPPPEGHVSKALWKFAHGRRILSRGDGGQARRKRKDTVYT